MLDHFDSSRPSTFDLEALTGPSRRERSSLQAVWDGLANGTLVIETTTTGAEQCLLVLRHVTAPVLPRSATRAKGAAVLRDVLCGKLQKVVCSELRVSRATLAVMLKNAIGRMGIQSSISRVPVALAFLAHAAMRPELGLATVEGDPLAPSESCVVRVKPPYAVLESELSQAEFDVASQLLEGKSHSELATRRGRSPRTIANQLAAVFRKLGAQGRFDLLRVVVNRARVEPSVVRVKAASRSINMTT